MFFFSSFAYTLFYFTKDTHFDNVKIFRISEYLFGNILDVGSIVQHKAKIAKNLFVKMMKFVNNKIQDIKMRITM